MNKELTGLNNSIADFENTTNAQRQQQLMANNQAAMDAYNSLMRDKINYDYTAGRDRVGDQRYNQEYGNSIKQQEYGNALTLLQLGYGTSNVAKMLGLSESDVKSYADYVQYGRDYEKRRNEAELWALMNPKSSGGSKSSSKAKTLTYGQAKEELKGGNYSPVALSVFKEYNGEAYKTAGTEKIDSIYRNVKSRGMDAIQNKPVKTDTFAFKEMERAQEFKEKAKEGLTPHWENSSRYSHEHR